MESKYIVRIIVDFTILLIVGTSAIMVRKLGKPVERGIFCEDETIRYPYTDHETVSDLVLLLFGVVLPMAVCWEYRYQRINVGDTGWIPENARTLMAFPILLFFLLGKPFERGLHCDDESLMYPYKDSTISSVVLYIVGTFLPVVAMGIIEMSRVQRENVGKRIIMCNRELHPWFWAMHCTVGPFLFACACSQLLTDIAKYSVGRLRPHFIDVCKPDFSQVNCTHGDYIDPVRCTTEDWFRLKEARLSFPSGHASFSAVTMVYFAIYLQARLHTRIAILIRPVLQFFALTLTFYTTLSRISDYKHHWSDVLAGFLLGSTVGILASLYVSDLFRRPTPQLEKNPQHLALQDCHPACAESATVQSMNGERRD